MPIKKSTRWLLAAIGLLLLAWLYTLLGPNPEIIVSKETTFITSPLSPDGLPNFFQAWYERQKVGITPDNNAAVLFWQAMGDPSGEVNSFTRKHFVALCREIGSEPVPARGSGLQEIYPAQEPELVEWLKSPGAMPENARKAWKLDEVQAASKTQDVSLSESTIGTYENFAAELDSRAYSPWKTGQLPIHAKWLADNQWRLDLLRRAVQRPRWFSTIQSLRGTPNLKSYHIATLMAIRSAARVLQISANWHVGENRLHEAWRDIQTIRALSRLSTQSGSLTDQLVATAIEGSALSCLQYLLSTSVDAELSKQILLELNGVPTVDSFASAHDFYERLFAIESVIACSKTSEWGELISNFHFDSSTGDFVHDESNLAWLLNRTSVDPNPLLITLNKLRNLQVKVLNDHNLSPLEKANALNDIAKRTEAKSLGLWDYAVAILSPAARADLAAQQGRSMFVWAESSSYVAYLRTRCLLQLTRVAAAIAVYHAKYGRYPAQLSELVPNVLDTLPADILNGKPLVYRRTDEGYLIYSLGENGVDDGGSRSGSLSWGRLSLEGRDIEFEKVYDPETGFWRDLTENDQYEALLEKIPVDADDIALRIPPPYEPWPWELQPPEISEDEMGMGL